MLVLTMILGQLVCIFWPLPRLVKAIPQDMTVAPPIPSRESDGMPRLFRSPLQLSDAVRRLAVAANDHSYDFLDSRDPDDKENILRIMNNLLSFSQPKSLVPDSARSTTDIAPNNYSLHPKRTTIVYIKDQSFIVGAHRNLAVDYFMQLDDPLRFCRLNSEIARKHFRDDHARLFNSLVSLLEGQEYTSHGYSKFVKLLSLSQPNFIIDAL